MFPYNGCCDSEQVHQLALQEGITPISASSWHTNMPTHATLMQRKNTHTLFLKADDRRCAALPVLGASIIVRHTLNVTQSSIRVKGARVVLVFVQMEPKPKCLSHLLTRFWASLWPCCSRCMMCYCNVCTSSQRQLSYKDTLPLKGI